MNDASEQSGGRTGNEGASFARSVRARAAAIVALLAFAALALVAALAALQSWSAERSLLLARGSGWVACGALLISLAGTAVGRSAWARRWAIPAPVWRRAFGMAAAWLGGVHALAALLGRLDGQASALLRSAQLIAGLSALAVLALLLLTSFEAVIRRLRLRYWKELHRLSYAAALLVAQHVLLAPFASRRLA
ncbi:MAG TPA: ferric reductase-like transmembrane domain-containing protein, partial [Polyangiales bacterium]|nr:ferric reductase-like transmembrane domain-containing protein [Polyangiales bacterium]